MTSFDPDSFLRKDSLGRYKIDAKIIFANGLLPFTNVMGGQFNFDSYTCNLVHFLLLFARPASKR